MHRKFAFLIASVVAPVAALAGIAGCKPRPTDSQPPPTQTLIDGPTGGELGQNGLPPNVYHGYKLELERRMGEPLISGAGDLNSKFNVTPDDTFVKDATSCAVDSGVVKQGYDGKMYDTSGAYVFGGGTSLLRSTTSWPAAALAVQPGREDLHACMATRLNPSAKPVTIWLGGGNTNDDKLDHKPFRIEEALWATVDNGIQQGSDGKDRLDLEIHVFPFAAIDQSCQAMGSVKAVTTRVCGTPTGMCGLTVRDLSECHHDSLTGHATCPRFVEPGCRCDDRDQPVGCTAKNTCQKVIETRMRCEDWCTLYPDCIVPAGCDLQGKPCKSP